MSKEFGKEFIASEVIIAHWLWRHIGVPAAEAYRDNLEKWEGVYSV